MNSLYLDLMESCLTGALFGDPALNTGIYDEESRLIGGDWPSVAHSMIGLQRMHQLRVACESVLGRGISGDFIETGVWRGGACLMMRAVLLAWGDNRRSVWCCDSFAGLPEPDRPEDEGDDHFMRQELAVSLEEVQENFRRYGLLDSQVKFVKGLFKDTLPKLTMERIAVLRLDGDMYGSTMDALTCLYPKLSVGGYCIVDDYGAVPGCKRAVDAYRELLVDPEPIQKIDWGGIFWEKRS